MNKEFLYKNFLAVISNSLALAQVFVVILFFENYFIYSQKTSLFDLTIDFDHIALNPFLWFFFFIAGAKIVWFIIVYVLVELINIRLDFQDDGIKFSSNVHFTIFLLICLSAVYLHSISMNTSMAPFNAEQHCFLFMLYEGVFYIITTFGVLTMLIIGVKTDNETEKAPDKSEAFSVKVRDKSSE